MFAIYWSITPHCQGRGGDNGYDDDFEELWCLGVDLQVEHQDIHLAYPSISYIL